VRTAEASPGTTDRPAQKKAAAAGDPEAKVDFRASKGIGAKSEKVTNGDGSPRAATVP
jgi:predicted flap endonuclease-1-like 5' DNA nuclease